MKGVLPLLILLLLVTTRVIKSDAQIRNHAKWNYAVEKVSEKQLQVLLTVSLDSGWHVYSSEMAEGGPQKTIITIEPGNSFKVSPKTTESGKLIEKFDSSFKITLRYYPKMVVFKKIIDVADTSAFFLKGRVSYMLCTDEVCLPPEEKEFTINVPVVSQIAPAKNDAATTTIQAANRSVKQKSLSQHSFLYIFIAGFLAGLAALLTPCVFPMIPMTVSFFTKRSKTRAQGLRNAFTYALSIIAIYVILGLGVSKIFGIDALNSLSTNVWFNLIFFVLLLIFAASFFGEFEITLPSSLINKVDKQSGKGGLIGIFFMAFTLSLVSFSCTGPIVGTLLFESAATGSISGPLWGMIGFSTALALPFGLFAAFPGWLNSLPKSGGWLNSVKVSLGFIELSLALKFLSNADLVMQANILTREIFLVLWINIFALWGLYLLGKIKFSHDSEVTYLSFPRLSLIILIFSFTLYLVPGLWGAPLKLISGFPPPDFYSEWKHNTVSTTSTTSDAVITTNEHCPNGLNCFHDYEEGLAYAKKVNKPILLDFTGWACVNCRKMENLVWTDPLIDAKLRNDVVLISLYVDDKRSLPDVEITTKKLGNKVYNIKTIGSKWSYFQASKFN
ncbi:MAG: cytochrome c biogenesis protein CcdA, partial [Sediminibacterium sp.]|nr:cytochrome c biogenesis protein CcdA [Sediminibacterium sp.]